MRSATVERRPSSIQHSSGCMMLPNMLRTPRIFWIIAELLVMATPPSMSL